MARKDVEIEIKVRIENPKNLLSFLEKNAEFKGGERQVDEYFTPAHRNFLAVRPVNEWLRLRAEGGKCSLNYKNWHVHEDGRKYYCDEFETIVEDSGQFRNLFAALNFKSVCKVDKLRKTWHFENFEISLDTVIGLGDFVEIELKHSHKNPKKATEEMVEFLKSKGVGRMQRNYQGYPFLLLFPEEVEFHEE